MTRRSYQSWLDEMARRAREHPDGEGLPGTGIPDDPAELQARLDDEPARRASRKRGRR